MCVCGGITEEAFGFVNMYSVEIVTVNFMKGVACETTTKKNGNLIYDKYHDCRFAIWKFSIAMVTIMRAGRLADK